MKISYIINTAAADPWIDGSNPFRSATYKRRLELLETKVLPAALAQGFDEVIVAGSYTAGSDYLYVPVPPRHRDRRDALYQREMGARYATGDVLVFGHDDHALAENFEHRLHRWLSLEDENEKFPKWDLLIPRRIHGITGAVMNNGLGDGPNGVDYMGGHVLVMRRWLWAMVPWTSVDSEFWDCTQTRLWRQAGGQMVFADDLIHVDVEAAANEV